MSIAEIAVEVGWSQWKTSKRIDQLGLSWIKRKNRKLSRGHAALLGIMQRLLPGEEIVTEHQVGERLRLDIYCQSYRLGAEYHGRQHFYYSDLFYSSESDFKAAQQRDDRKLELCKEQGIALVVFRWNDKMDEDIVFDRMLEAIRTTPYIKDPKPRSSFKGNHYYEAMKQKNREYRKQQYRQYKKRNG